MGCCPPPADRGGAASPSPAAPAAPAARRAPPERLVRLPGGKSQVGTATPLFPQDSESPRRAVRVRPFAIDPFAVTNAWFAEFVADTGHVTEAERFGWSYVFHLLLPEDHLPTHRVVAAPWWCQVHGAMWSAPEGPGSSIAGREDHPVVHLSWNDAMSFAAWAGGRLPTEAEWEYAARGGAADARYPWGERDPDDDGFQPCNIWQGDFPRTNTVKDGFLGTAPVHAFAPNGFGLHNMSGNAWEWCFDLFRTRSLRQAARRNVSEMPRRLVKGGSYLCHASYCHRYRIAARTGNTPDSTTGHTGLRLVFDLD